MHLIHDENSQEREFASFSRSRMFEAHGNWIQQKEKLREKFGLSYSELAFKDGKKDEMLTKLQIKLGFTKEEFRDILASL
jgi:hypothetical protein